MAGHSHWANIAHKKSLIDSRRGKLWSKLARAIIVAAKEGGGDPVTNLKLRYAINDAKAVSMPKDNIERAIKKGTGELEGGNLEQALYEGYGPGGVAVLCEIYTDNRNRTAPEVRKIFELAGGKLGATGCVAWMFDRKGLARVARTKIDENSLMELALEAGADDVRVAGETYEIIAEPEAFGAVTSALEGAGIELDGTELTRLPKDTVAVTGDDARKVLKLVEALDDHDDVQSVAANFNIPDEALAELSEG
ncbi:MAG TPA: YebC/PmpR family DNA-binding transcriptional regulator [Lacipirellulaceae bacterium]|nr:YebC/PmpR family DNA-binding transcriptional regulator [Lacipirellulaceae bacterium]HMP05661.1 YebC/PmpR family DNA-binding transcriptional regulator [Lacipirellulaceae bacterium]